MEMFSYGFMQRALIMSVFIALLCPCIGMMAVLRRNSMIGDTLAHASLAGVSVALIIPVNPLAGSFVFTSLCGLLIEWLRLYFKAYSDLILSIVLALSVGIAVTIMSRGGLGIPAETFLFGSMLTVTVADLIVVMILAAAALILMRYFYDELLFSIYDEDSARIAGVKVRMIACVMAVLTAAAAAVSIQAVGALVLSSLITIPVAVALQCQVGFKATLMIAVICAQISVFSGLCLSYIYDCAPGGMIALSAVSLLGLMMLGRRLLLKLRRA